MAEEEHHQVRLRSGDIVWRQVGDEVVVLDTSSSNYLSVNRSAAALWPLLVEGATPDVLANALASRYGIGQEQATTDVSALVLSLEQLGLLEASSDQPSL